MYGPVGADSRRPRHEPANNRWRPEGGPSVVPEPGVQVKQETHNDICKNELAIAKLSDCKILALNSGLTEQVRMYNAELRKFDDFYNKSIIYHAGRSLGFLGGIVYRRGFTNPTRKQIKEIAMELYFRQCGMFF